MADHLDRLLEEIEFWQMLVDRYNGDRGDPSYGRISSALELAEYRFSNACGAEASMH